MITKQIYPWYSSCEEYSYSVGNAELRDYLNYANIPSLILGVLAAGNTETRGPLKLCQYTTLILGVLAMGNTLILHGIQFKGTT